MAMKGLSLDGANKLKAALDTYYKGISMGGLGWNSGAYYGKGTPMAKLCDEIIKYVYGRSAAGRTVIDKYVGELNQVVKSYQSFDNSGSSTLGKVISNKKS